MGRLRTCLLFAVALSVFAQVSKDLIEQGLYHEETLGDLSAALELYRHALDKAESREVRAQAMLHLGLGYLKAGRRDMGEVTLRNLLNLFPEHRELVHRARQGLGYMQELPIPDEIPWPAFENLFYLEQSPSRQLPGLMMIHAIPDGEDGWQILEWRETGVYQSRCEFRMGGKDLKPISGRFTSRDYGNVSTRFEDHVLHVTTDSGERQIPLTRTTYLEPQCLYLGRMLPFAKGNIDLTIPVFAEGMNMAFDFDVRSAGTEQVTVPAGTYDCYRLESSLNFVVWVAIEAPHYVVKVHTPDFVSSLAVIDKHDPSQARRVTLSDAPLQLLIPPGWYYFPWPDQSSFQAQLVLPWQGARARISLVESPDESVDPSPYREGEHLRIRQRFYYPRNGGTLSLLLDARADHFEWVRDQLSQLKVSDP